MTCQAPTKPVSDTPTTLNTRTTQVAESTSSDPIHPITTTESSSSTGITLATCPTGIQGSALCQPLDSLPTQSVSINGILDHWPQSDGDVEPPVPRVCNAFGMTLIVMSAMTVRLFEILLHLQTRSERMNLYINLISCKL
jgi:hypothetical protein